MPKIAIVTGSSKGIGRAVALRLARDGAQVVLSARSKDLLDNAVSEIEQCGGQALAVALDLRAPDAATQLVDATVAAFGGVDILVNNAGATTRGEFENLSDDEWTDGFALKFFGAVRLTRAAWPHLKRRSGSVINIAGVGGRTPGAQFSIGGSVNAALLSLTKALADLGIRDGVQVNAINPGPIRTDRLHRRLAAEAAKSGCEADAATGAFIRAAQIKRIGEPADVANLVAFVTGGDGEFLQGALIDLDGGQTKTI